jgi:hypothetical protein
MGHSSACITEINLTDQDFFVGGSYLQGDNEVDGSEEARAIDDWGIFLEVTSAVDRCISSSDPIGQVMCQPVFQDSAACAFQSMLGYFSYGLDCCTLKFWDDGGR